MPKSLTVAAVASANRSAFALTSGVSGCPSDFSKASYLASK